MLLTSRQSCPKPYPATVEKQKISNSGELDIIRIVAVPRMLRSHIPLANHSHYVPTLSSITATYPFDPEPRHVPPQRASLPLSVSRMFEAGARFPDPQEAVKVWNKHLRLSEVALKNTVLVGGTE